MPAVPVDTWYLGAGDVYVDNVKLGSTRENNVFTVLHELDAPIVNGVGGKLRKSDYYIRRPYPQLMVTFIEMDDATFPYIMPGATASTVAQSGESGSNDVLITPPSYRRLLLADYHEWELRVPGVGGKDVHFRIPAGIQVANPEFTAQDAAVPLGPRLTIEGRFREDDDAAPSWDILLVDHLA